MRTCSLTFSTESDLPAVGWYFGRVFAFVHLGTQRVRYEEGEVSKPQCVLGYRLADASGTVRDFWKQYTISNSSRSTLYLHLKQAGWFNDTAQIDLVQLVGRVAYVLIQHGQTKQGLPTAFIESLSPTQSPPAEWHIDREAFLMGGTFTVFLGDTVPEAQLTIMPTWLADKLRDDAPAVPVGYGQKWAPPPAQPAPPPPQAPSVPPPPPPAQPAPPPAKDDEGW